MRREILKYFPLFLLTVATFFSACKEDLDEIYQRPDWLKGKLITQMRTQDDLQIFLQLLEKTGYDTILNTSGSFTVFAPTDEAFSQFFVQNPEYQTMLSATETDDRLRDLVEFQVIYNAWSKSQFTTLDNNGWIQPNDKYAKPRAYKRQTLNEYEDQTYPVRKKANYYQIVDPSISTSDKIVFNRKKKFAPIFFKGFLDFAKLSSDDYEYYFDQQFNANDIYYCSAELGEAIPAENGFIYKTDKVVMPLKNAEELLKLGHEGYSYSDFLNLIYGLSEITTDVTATFEQPEARAGLDYDSLYNLTFPKLVFDIHNEASRISQNWAFSNHSGLVAPTNEAIQNFETNYLNAWGGFENIPPEVKQVFVNTYMSEDAIFQRNIYQGFLNGVGDSVYIDQGSIIQNEFGSNCTFIGVNEPIIPRVFQSVSAPVFLSKDYNTMLYALSFSRVISALTNPAANYSFFIPKDANIGMSGDSSLIREVYNTEYNLYNFLSFNLVDGTRVPLPKTELRLKLLNQIGETVPDGIARKEFIKTLGGNYIVFDNENNIVSGTRASVRGYNGSELVDLIPVPFTMDIDNGITYDVQTFFTFNRTTTYYILFINNYIKFHQLLIKAGLYNASTNSYSFINQGEEYTVFVPSQTALENYQADTLSIEELRDFLKYHFVSGELIFTDGKQPSGDYPTAVEDESSTVINKVYSKIRINTGSDYIDILDPDNQLYYRLEENGNKTNQFVIRRPNENSTSDWNFITNGVVHQIDTVLVRNKLKTN